MSNRTRTEIIADMLEGMLAPVTITRIMYKSRLSFSQLKEYREYLLSKGLAKQENELWVITSKGRAFLEAYNNAMKILEEPMVMNLYESALDLA